jgi:hypothetical protein
MIANDLKGLLLLNEKPACVHAELNRLGFETTRLPTRKPYIELVKTNAYCYASGTYDFHTNKNLLIRMHELEQFLILNSLGVSIEDSLKLIRSASTGGS